VFQNESVASPTQTGKAISPLGATQEAPQPSTPPTSVEGALADGQARIMIQVRGLFMELGDVQQKLATKEQQLDEAKNEITQLKKQLNAADDIRRQLQLKIDQADFDRHTVDVAHAETNASLARDLAQSRQETQALLERFNSLVRGPAKPG
jgi:chromosome segregation ATPase